MHLQECCVEDGEMSVDFQKIAKSKKYVVQCKTSIGWITTDTPEYRNGVSYRVIRKDELK